MVLADEGREEVASDEVMSALSAESYTLLGGAEDVAVECPHEDECHEEWVTGIAVCRMTDSHLRNAREWLRRMVAGAFSGYVPQGEIALEDFERAEAEADYFADVLQGELDRRERKARGLTRSV